jgi:hypothetical protein
MPPLSLERSGEHIAIRKAFCYSLKHPYFVYVFAASFISITVFETLSLHKAKALR